MPEKLMTIADAVRACRETGLSGWDFVAFAQRLVAGRMTYSYFNSFDRPEAAFEKGMGYCWQQAGALNKILLKLGFDSRLVHAFRNRFPDVVRDGVTIHIGVSGHVWCRVRIGGEEKDVGPGSPDNTPGRLHFTPLGKVYNFRGPIVLLSYLGSAAVNRQRGRRFLAEKAKLLKP
jgi:transglutaminase-like putative cysteine protease